MAAPTIDLVAEICGSSATSAESLGMFRRIDRSNNQGLLRT